MLGEFVKEARERRGWSQEDLARESGLRQEHISAIETGKTKLPRDHTLDKLGAALGLTRGEFYQAAGVLDGLLPAPTRPVETLWPEDSRVAEARVRLAERRRIVEDLYIESRDKATYDTRRAALDAEEATLPVPLPLAAGYIEDLARGQELWRAGKVSVRHRNALLRSSFARVVITGRECAIEPVPLLERLIEATERARAVGVG